MGAPSSRAAVAEHARAFLTGCANAMAVCAESRAQAKMVTAFAERVKHAQTKNFKPNPLPCLGNLRAVKDMKLAKDFQHFAHDLPWSFSPRTDDRGEHMAIMEFGKMFEMGKIIAGLMYVDAGRAYPEHNHPSPEVYFLISGTAKWRWGGHKNYRRITAGNLIYNHPYDWHGVEAGSMPVLALYLQVM